ncbi:hypothetical protein BBJ28_00019616 [Nothophytophthora sp. Chile5]|nr:hypothetical protein BBJ28_00019616 [Nothophytophthora sp. Chile5]
MAAIYLDIDLARWPAGHVPGWKTVETLPCSNAPSYRERAVVEHAIATGLIQDDEHDSSGEESGGGESSGGESGGGGGGGESGGGGGVESSGGDAVRASQIDCSVALSANTVDALVGSDSEGDEPPALSQGAVGRAFVDSTEQTVVIGASQRLLSEAEPDEESGDESADESKDDRECDDDSGPRVPRDLADVNLMKPGEHRDEYESLSSGSDYGQFSDDDDVEPVRPQSEEDEPSDDEVSPHMDAAFIETLGGTLSIDHMDKDALRELEWSPTSTTFEDDVTCFPGLVQDTARPIPELRAKKDSPLDLLFYFLPKSLWMRITSETNRVKRQTIKDEDFLAAPTPSPAARKRRRPAFSGHTLVQFDDWVTVKGGIQKRRQRSCKVCSLYRGQAKKSFQTTYYCPDCSNGDAKFYLCDKARRGGDKTCFQVWHEEFACGADIPAHLGKRVVLRRAPKAVGVRKKTRREILREDNVSDEEEAGS